MFGKFRKWNVSRTKTGHPMMVGVFTEGLDKNTYAYPSLEAFAKGVTETGDAVKLIDNLKYEPCDIAVIFGDVRDGKGKESRMCFKAEVKGRHIHRGLIVIDTAILTRSSAVGSLYRRIGIDGLLRDEGDFNNEDCPPDRWEKLSAHGNIKLRPWRTDGDHILIALQRPLDASLKSSPALRPVKYRNWVTSTVQGLLPHTSLPVHIRPHPGSLGQDWERGWLDDLRQELSETVVWDESPKSFEETLLNCRTCITYNSGAGVDAAIAGIPVITGNTGSFAWEVASHSLDTVDAPYCPDRTQWLNNLAYAEWSLDEISEGLPWRHLKPRILSFL